ncbi:uncharacterized protein LOC127632944 [Xyrauchen texanus]|uniref:uncharacterized protein LOC127632944 n=1 Tax=Xyrauchen texanus TaxID=154827 RepID=UPI00224235A8|nr:uncharacterized protein LOC127632944 [Xyrauchen texanus]XP_051967750.1 uncharacterized protein LOC127632944 [Xyrauchen texanus]
MAAEGSLVSGGVMFVHTESEGKHSYEVKNFLNHNNGIFIRNGDKLLMINGTDTEGLPPESVADILVKGSPLLTIHHPCKEQTAKCASEEISAYKKEPTVMRFSLMMVREENLENVDRQETSYPEAEWEDMDIEGDCFSDDDLLLVSMGGTSFSMVVSRGTDADNPCHNCGKTDCQFNEVVIKPETAEIASNSARIVKLMKERSNLYLKSVLKNKYFTPSRQQILLNDSMSAQITIYYYMSNALDCHAGVPVVLNFTGTNNFFRCTTEKDKKVLILMNYTKSELKKICAEDSEKWSFVFYMTSERDNLRRFESALHRGWFIQIQSVSECDEVGMQEKNQVDNDPSNIFFIIIES